MGSLGVRHNWATSLSLFTFMHWRRKWQPTPLFLPGESEGQVSLVGCHLGSHRVGHDWSNLAAEAAFFTVQLSHPYMTIGKTIALTRRTFGGKVMSLLLNMLDMLSHSSHVQLCVTPRTAAHQALLSLGFSRQEQWSGLPFPSPTFENGKWKWSRSVLSDSSQPHGLKPTRLLRPWDFPGKSTGVGCHCLL